MGRLPAWDGAACHVYRPLPRDAAPLPEPSLPAALSVHRAESQGPLSSSPAFLSCLENLWAGLRAEFNVGPGAALRLNHALPTAGATARVLCA